MSRVYGSPARARELSSSVEGETMKRQTVQSSIEINAAIDVAWGVLNDPDAYEEAIDWVYEARVDGEGPLGEGSVYVERAKPGIKEGTYRWEVTASQPPKRAVHAHQGAEMEAELEILFEPLDEERTRLTQIMRFRALPGFRPLGFLLERTVMKRKMQRDFDEMILPGFKRIAEKRHASQEPPANPS